MKEDLDIKALVKVREVIQIRMKTKKQFKLSVQTLRELNLSMKINCPPSKMIGKLIMR